MVSDGVLDGVTVFVIVGAGVSVGLLVAATMGELGVFPQADRNKKSETAIIKAA